jgi:two-component system OmpR family response regulator
VSAGEPQNTVEEPQRMQVLIIDDDPALLATVSSFLEDGGYDVRTATAGQEGIRLALEVVPDVILLDVHMPDLDGYVVCHMLRGRGLGISNI